MQDLEKFKNEMNLSGQNVYVGHRYVPKFDGVWDNSKTYEPLTIVQNQGNSFTSRQYVPVGVEITNEEYWASTGNYNAQIEQYRQDVVNMNGSLNDLIQNNDSKFDTIISDFNNVNSKLNNLNIVNVKDFEATGDGVTDDTVAIQNAIDYLQSVGGGKLFFPSGRYKVSTIDDKYGCLWINSDNIQIEGVGKASEIFTTEDAHVPIHVSAEKDLTVTGISKKLKNFTIKNMSVKGTGNYVYFGTGKGRGILLRGVVNA